MEKAGQVLEQRHLDNTFRVGIKGVVRIFSKGTAANVAVHQSAHKLRDTFLFPKADRVTVGTQRRNEEINQTIDRESEQKKEEKKLID